MTSTTERSTAGARARRALLVLLGVMVVLGPIPLGLVWAWTVHPLLVVPAYLVGIAAWLCLLSGAWALVQRVRALLPGRRDRTPDVLEVGPPPTGAAEADGAAHAAPGLPVVRSDLRLPAPREGSEAPQRVRTPTP